MVSQWMLATYAAMTPNWRVMWQISRPCTNSYVIQVVGSKKSGSFVLRVQLLYEDYYRPTNFLLWWIAAFYLFDSAYGRKLVSLWKFYVPIGVPRLSQSHRASGTAMRNWPPSMSPVLISSSSSLLLFFHGAICIIILLYQIKVCNGCFANLRSCPMCGGSLSEKRNLALERICEHVRYPCESDDCSVICETGPVALRTHMENCRFCVKFFVCPFPRCA